MVEINCGDDSSRLGKSVIYYGLKIQNENNINTKVMNAISTSRKNFKKLKTEYTLSYGTHKINFNNTDIEISYKKYGNPKDNGRGELKYYTEITLNNNDVKNECILKEFIEQSKKYYNDKILEKDSDNNKITVHLWDDYWDELRTSPKRSIDTIYLNDNLHTKVLDDMKNFLNKETEEEYRKFGMPYKKNYLFEGIPGTGKTSLIYALASELDLDVCIFNFTPKTTDGLMARAITRIPDDCILILEDIDVLYEGRKRNNDNVCPVSFSGLLNILDGLAHHDKLITIMTTNYKCNLDKALKRKGRIDTTIHFGYANKEQIKNMYNNFLPLQKDKFDEFYNNVKCKKVTTSVLQQYFFDNKDEDNILKNIKDLNDYIEESQFNQKELNMYV